MKKHHQPLGSCAKQLDDATWAPPLVPLEDGWLDKMDTTLAATADSFFHDLSWSDSADSLLSSPPLGAVKAHRLSVSEVFETPTKSNDFSLYSLTVDTLFDAPSDSISMAASPQSAGATDAESPSRDWGGWCWADQRVFFQTMKAKWVAHDALEKRWEQLAKKIASKTRAQIEAFYADMVKHVSSLLMHGQVAMDANQPDEVRLALICWYRLVASSSITSTDFANPVHKRAIVARLATAFLKSRKQMIAAKSVKKTKEALLVATPPVHHPIVRKKRALPEAQVAPQKRPRPASPIREFSPASSPEPVRPAATVASPFADVTPSKNKRQIKVRFVPIDKRTQALVSQTGAMPKVELKMSSSKRISDVCEHMMKKWTAVQPLLPVGSTLRVVPLGDRLHPGWGSHDISVTCLDIFNHCQKYQTDQLVDTVTLEYRWEVEADENVPPYSASSPLATEYTTPQRVKLPRSVSLTAEKPIPVPVDLDLLPSPHATHDPDPKMTLNFSTDFNGFLDEGPGACTALMDSLCDERKPLKRITPTLVSPVIRLDMLPPP
ncbi:hypothetical protein ACHHYP_14081 [Achlya hypogyna]|uniref:Myb-like domain-containing protein n=1 Tax=Achlya hypogyna TaxID=1202772 RepID=A0A1V9YE27_ACHHY|nr:hypothetical protein ACHHYP_14081 [Achlya hypogyna]